MDCSLPGSSIHGIFQAKVLEWGAISFSRGSSWPRDRGQYDANITLPYKELIHVANSRNNISSSSPAQELLQEHTWNSIAITHSLLQFEAVVRPVFHALIKRQGYPDLTFQSRTLNLLCSTFVFHQSRVVHSWQEYHRSNVATGQEARVSYVPLGDVKLHSLANWSFQCSSLCQKLYWNQHEKEHTRKKAMAPHSSTLAWKIPWTEEPGRLQSRGC